MKYLHRFGDQICHGGNFFTEMCKLDNLDCQEFATEAPNCNYDDLAGQVPDGQEPKLGDGICESTIYNTPECLFENGDCNKCNDIVSNYALTGDTVCHGGQHNTDECNFDGGDCASFNDKWPNCANKAAEEFPDMRTMSVPIIGNGICDSGLYNIEECGFEDGDCIVCDENISDPKKVRFYLQEDGICIPSLVFFPLTYNQSDWQRFL